MKIITKKTKICSRYDKKLSISPEYFWRNAASPDGFSAMCKKCKTEKYKDSHRVSLLKYINSNKEKVKKYYIQWQEEFREWYENLKQKPCADCGIIYPPMFMHWDHLSQYEKEFNICDLYRNGKREAILEEIKKCELVCGTCHKSRHKIGGIHYGGS